MNWAVYVASVGETNTHRISVGKAEWKIKVGMQCVGDKNNIKVNVIICGIWSLIGFVLLWIEDSNGTSRTKRWIHKSCEYLGLQSEVVFCRSSFTQEVTPVNESCFLH
jgi:hypothetical protein